MEQFRFVLHNVWNSRDAPQFSPLNLFHSSQRTTHLDFSWFWVWYSSQAEQTMAWSSWQRSNTEIRERKLKWIRQLRAQGASSEHKVPSTQFQQFHSFYFIGNSSDKGHLQLHCFPQNHRPVRTCTQHADAKYWCLGISWALQDTFWPTRILLKCKKINHRITEPFWLGKLSKIMEFTESNHSSSTTKNITDPQPQVLHPQGFKSHQQWGSRSSHRATKNTHMANLSPKISQSPPRTYTQAAEPAPTCSEPPPVKNQPQTAGSSLSMIVEERRTDSRATTSKRGFWQFICGGFMASYLQKEL